MKMLRTTLILAALVLAVPATAAADPLQITTATNHTGYVSLQGYRIPTSATGECISLSNSPAKTGPVNFYLDSQTTVYHTENSAPWDMLSGGTNDATGACRLGTIATGNHYVKATWGGGGTDQESFTVGPVPDTSISSVADADSAPTFIDEDGNGSEQVNVTFSGTNSVNRRECAISGATTQAFTTCTSVWSPTVNVGSNTVSVRACDNAGCDATPATSTFTMQAAPPLPAPDTTISAVADNDSPTLIDEDGNGSEAVGVSFSGTNSPTSYTCSVSGATTIANTSCSSPWQATVNTGSNTVIVTACNSGGCDATPATNTFTMAAAPPPSGDPLVSTGDPATASSQEAARPPSLALDQNTTTRWGSILDGAGGTGHDNEWIYVDLGQSYNVSRVRLNWEAAYATAYKIQVSDNASTWTDAYSTTTGDGAIDDLTLTATGRYVRMLGVTRATAWGYSLWELEVYGTPNGSPPPPPDPTTPPAPGTWHQTFNDDFSSIDTNKWGFLFWWNGDTFWPNKELQVYHSNRCTSDGNALSENAVKEVGTVTASNGSTKNSDGEPYQYTSCWMSTGGTQGTPAKYLFTYGYAEARIWFAGGKGLWPGFWMQGRDSTNGTSFDDGHEIDIVELIGQRPSEANLNYHGPSGGAGSVYTCGCDLTAGYHTYAVDWEPGSIVWYVDGVARFTLNRSDVPTTPRYVMFNFAVGGANSWPGAPDASTVFPAVTKVDWVHVWQH